MEDFESLVHMSRECKCYGVWLISREFRIQDSEFRSRSRSSGTDSSPSDRGNLPELKLGAQDSLSRPLSPCVTGFSP